MFALPELAPKKELLKPFLRGRDVKRWRVDFADQYLIKIESSANVRHSWSDESEKEAEANFANAFPAIHAHFAQFRKGLIGRDDQGRFFWELRPCAYWQEFERPKVILGRFMNSAVFAFDREGFFHNDALYMIPVDSEYIAATLNSPVAWYYLRKTCTDLQNGYLQAYRENLFAIPIPFGDANTKASLEKFVGRILKLKKDNPATDVSSLETEINDLVSRLFGLTVEESRIIKEVGGRNS